MDTVLVARPMQWAAIPDFSETKPLSQREKDCLRAVRDALSAYGCLDTFGVSLIHKHFDIADDEILLETIDVEARTLSVRPVKKADQPQAIETQWLLSEGDAVMVCHGYCAPGGGHRRFHNPL